MVPLPVKKKSEHGKAPTKTPSVQDLISLYVQLSTLKHKPVNTFIIVQVTRWHKAKKIWFFWQTWQQFWALQYVLTNIGSLFTPCYDQQHPCLSYSMVFPERTFYLCAFTGIEAEEWIAILSWKLVSDKSQI